ncbi:fumarylacetoacetate hydrolase family protein [Zhihengliuella salsuginis]|uniref:2-hydroxyhepta-2,4-diene-1,7-dioate isomerase n=1 Tax=Zhihengliuella salsuginis TaxID=578222 RepID=A0ABQ3GGH3_9MICC|nr:fumarylacetoacetate hydrolase family protein [Zhihengliuella salsuginis]GHD05191.1 2-hydroxyhepta-2,4-diene-1,7-dioate isomerase [Zhihengliuella salsuginis]
MRLATIRRDGQPGATFAALIEDGRALELVGYDDVGTFLAAPDADRAEALTDTGGKSGTPVADADFAPLVPTPSKIFCIGLNYRNHALETGNEIPAYPTIFTKFADSLCGANDSVEIPAEEHRIDWEGELAIVIGTGGRRIAEPDAGAAIAGYAVSNDVSMRGWQGRTPEWTQGKCWEASTPVGPYLVTTDEFSPGAKIETRVNGHVVQQDSTGDLIFTPEALVAYCSTMVTLRPGDLILTGTPAGVALGRKDPETGRRPWLRAGDVLETEIEGLGTQRTVFT